MKIWIIIIAVFVAATLGFVIWAIPPHFVQQIGLPKTARDLPANFKQAELEFDNRVRSQYEEGTSEVDLVSKLEKDGFKTDINNKTGGVSRNGFPCALKWWITWKTSASGDVTELSGHYGGVCL